ncbi:UNVERIFIED_CONTAM: Malignant T-cell-amplified sequence 1 [Sesamum indicum]
MRAQDGQGSSWKLLNSLFEAFDKIEEVCEAPGIYLQSPGDGCAFDDFMVQVGKQFPELFSFGLKTKNDIRCSLSLLWQLRAVNSEILVLQQYSWELYNSAVKSLTLWGCPFLEVTPCAIFREWVLSVNFRHVSFGFSSEEVSAQNQVKASVQRKIRQSIAEEYPGLEPVLEDLLPKKSPLIVAKCPNHLNLVLVNNVPLFFNIRDGPYMPTLRLLHQYPNIMKKLQVDRGAIKFVLAGANIMCPGLTSPGGALDDEVEAETPVAIMAEGKQHALAIGFTKMSAKDIRTINKGIGVDNMHYLNDGLWKVLSSALLLFFSFCNSRSLFPGVCSLCMLHKLKDGTPGISVKNRRALDASMRDRRQSHHCQGWAMLSSSPAHKRPSPPQKGATPPLPLFLKGRRLDLDAVARDLGNLAPIA